MTILQIRDRLLSILEAEQRKRDYRND